MLRAFVLRPNLVGADGLNLAQGVLFAGHANGDHKDERCSADDHAQRGQDEAHFVAAKSVVRETQDLAQGHIASRAVGHEGSGHL